LTTVKDEGSLCREAVYQKPFLEREQFTSTSAAARKGSRDPKINCRDSGFRRPVHFLIAAGNLEDGMRSRYSDKLLKKNGD